MKKDYVVAAAVDVVEVVAVGNEVEVVLGEVVGNNAALDGDDVEREHYHAVEAEAEAEVAKPVAAAGNGVAVAVASVHRTHPIHLQTRGQHCH